MTTITTPVFLLLFFVSLTGAGNRAADSSFDVSKVIERANAGISTRLEHGDIRRSRGRNADPCTAFGCKWYKRGRYVYVPVFISTDYTREQRDIIIQSLLAFHRSTCIKFVWRGWWHRTFLNFVSEDGCWSFVGRQRGRQDISLNRQYCLYTGTVQHEVLHALGFHHEQVRSDRDTYVSILTQNIIPEMVSNFEKVQTNNLETPYDFQSVMHYSNYAFSVNGKPTIVAKSDQNLIFGHAEEMNANDIERINKLYKCCE